MRFQAAWVVGMVGVMAPASLALAQPPPAAPASDPASPAADAPPSAEPSGSSDGPSANGASAEPAGPSADRSVDATAPGPVAGTTPHTELPPVPPDVLWRDEAEPREDSDIRYPGYVIAGLASLGLGVGLAVGGVVAAADAQAKDALGLGALATVAFGTGVPLTLLGATPEHPGDSPTAYAGIALATSGALGFGLGGTLLLAQEAERDQDPDYVASIALMGAGGAALVAGVITWAIGAAGDDDGDERGAEAHLVVGPTHLGLRGTF